MEFKGDTIITDPCYICKDNDWELCGYGENMSKLGITKCITSSTLYGDWSCQAFNCDTGELLGFFCADAGMVGVFLLEEILKYDPLFNLHLNKSHAATLIKDFNGDIEIEYDNEVDEMSVRGHGNINFYTRQIGL